jgi:hypothetical protein
LNRAKVRTLLALAAAAEAITGVALIASPPMVARLLLNAEVSGPGLAFGRVCGVALLSLGWACWPSQDNTRAAAAMLLYNLLAAVYLGYLGVSSELAGPLLWPAVSYHALMAVLLAWAWTKERGELK